MNPTRRIAVVQLVSGLLDAWCLAGVAWSSCGALCGALTGPAGHLGGLWGWLALLLMPLGWVEILVAIHALRTDDLRWNRRVAMLQVASLPIGGVAAAVVGAWVLWTTPSSP